MEKPVPLRILIGDDDPIVLELLERFLKEKGYQVACAKDGEDVLKKFEDYKPHLVLLDLRMPKYDGMEVLRLLKEKEPDIGVIIVSGNVDREVAVKTLEMGAFDYIPKPIDFAYLESSLRTWNWR